MCEPQPFLSRAREVALKRSRSEGLLRAMPAPSAPVAMQAGGAGDGKEVAGADQVMAAGDGQAVVEANHVRAVGVDDELAPVLLPQEERLKIASVAARQTAQGANPSGAGSGQ